MMRHLLWITIAIFITAMFSPSLASNDLPQFGERISVNTSSLFVIQQGCQQGQSPDAILLSGPTDHWNSDSAWFALLQPLLEKNYCTWSIDRAGHGWSKPVEPLGYEAFGHLLVQLSVKLKWTNTVLVAFASSNLATHSIATHTEHTDWVKGVVLIDPDVLTTRSIKQYANDAKPYQDKASQIETFIEEGKNDQRVQQIIAKETEHVLSIIPPELIEAFDSNRFKQTLANRLKREVQKSRAKELAVYENDLTFALNHPLPKHWVLTIINTDFEDRFIRETKENKELILWKKEGDQWMKELTEPSHRSYIHLNTEEHLVTFSDPDTIILAIDRILATDKIQRNNTPAKTM